MSRLFCLIGHSKAQRTSIYCLFRYFTETDLFEVRPRAATSLYKRHNNASMAIDNQLSANKPRANANPVLLPSVRAGDRIVEGNRWAHRRRREPSVVRSRRSASRTSKRPATLAAHPSQNYIATTMVYECPVSSCRARH